MNLRIEENEIYIDGKRISRGKIEVCVPDPTFFDNLILFKPRQEHYFTLITLAQRRKKPLYQLIDEALEKYLNSGD